MIFDNDTIEYNNLGCGGTCCDIACINIAMYQLIVRLSLLQSHY